MQVVWESSFGTDEEQVEEATVQDTASSFAYSPPAAWNTNPQYLVNFFGESGQYVDRSTLSPRTAKLLPPSVQQPLAVHRQPCHSPEMLFKFSAPSAQIMRLTRLNWMEDHRSHTTRPSCLIISKCLSTTLTIWDPGSTMCRLPTNLLYPVRA